MKGYLTIIPLGSNKHTSVDYLDSVVQSGSTEKCANILFNAD